MLATMMSGANERISTAGGGGLLFQGIVGVTAHYGWLRPSLGYASAETKRVWFLLSSCTNGVLSALRLLQKLETMSDAAIAELDKPGCASAESKRAWLCTRLAPVFGVNN